MKKMLSCLMLLSFGIVSAVAETSQMIVKDGKANAQIVIASENRPRMATLAALELQYYIQKISGAKLPIVTAVDTNVPVKIYVGKSLETDKLGIKTDDLKYGAFRIASGDNWIVLLGADFDFIPPQPMPKDRKDRKSVV